MVLLVLALIWAVVLLSWLRSRTAGSFGDSIGTFRRHLRVLEKTGPVTVLPANRMRGPSGIEAAGFTPVPLRPRQGTPRPGLAAQRGRSGAIGGYRSTGGRPALDGMVALRRRRGQKRRRDILLGLIGLAVVTLLLGLIPGLHTILYFQVIVDLLLAGYVALLVRMRNLSAERAAKVTYLPPVRPVAPGVVRQGTGRYASLASTAAAPAMESGELLLGSVVN